MHTHTIILKCQGNTIPDATRLEAILEAVVKNPQIEYFGHNGRRVYSNQKAVMESLKGKFFVQFSFHHLLKLDSLHSLALIKSAIKMGMVKMIRRNCDAIEVVLP